MRHVVKSREVYHLWAHQTQTDARCGNESFNGEYAYSYREPIGRIVKVKGVTYALFRDESFSVTTAKHQGSMRHAVNHLPSFTVYHIGGMSSYFYQSTAYRAMGDKIDHKSNLKHYQSRIEETATKAALATKRGEWLIGELTALVTEANAYVKLFNLKTKFTAPKLDRKAILAKTAVARERDKYRREHRAELEAIANAKRDAKDADLIRRWLAGESVEVPYRYGRNSFLRVEGEEVVTSHGARVPLDHVRRAAPIVRKIIERGEAWRTNGHTIHLGPYQLDSIDEDGSIRAGCHTFARDEVLRFLATI